MKTILIILSFFSAVVAVKAQRISYIETTKGWYNIYDQDGKMIKSLSSGLGQLVGYSSTFYIIKQKTGFYITYDVCGKQLHTFSIGIVGDILTVSGDTFTSRKGSWIFTWSKDGKIISSKSR
jgi:hypothetical protein